MEPVPPLAPPPARPGAGTPVVTAERTGGGGGPLVPLSLAALALVVAVLLILLILGRL